MDVLENLLIALSESLAVEDGSDTATLIENLEAHLFSDLDAVELEHACSLVFQSDSPPSVVRILQNSIGDSKECIANKGRLLKCLSRFIKSKHGNLAPYMAAFVPQWLGLFSKAASSEALKSHLLLPLKSMLQVLYKRKRLPAAEQGSFAQALQTALPQHLGTLYLRLLSEPDNGGIFRRESSKTLKSDLYTVIGLLFGCLPTEAESQKFSTRPPGQPGEDCKIVKTCYYNLNKEMDKNGSTSGPAVEVIAGIFSCLDRVFFELELNHRSTILKPKKLMGYIVAVILSAQNENMTRYRVVRKCLRLLKNHSELFASVLAQDELASKSWTYLRECHGLDKNALAKHSEDAAVALLQTFAKTIAKDVSTDKQESAKLRNVVTDAMHGFLNNINFQSASTEAGGTRTMPSLNVILLAVRGLAAIAPAISAAETAGGNVKGQQARPEMIVEALLSAAATLEFVEDGLGVLKNNSAEEAESGGMQSVYSSTITKTSYFLLAISGTIASCNINCSPQLIEYLKTAVGDIIVGHNLLPPRIKLLNRRSLCYLAQGFAKRSAQAGASDEQASLLSDYLTMLVPPLLLQTVGRVAMEPRVANQADGGRGSGGGQYQRQQDDSAVENEANPQQPDDDDEQRPDDDPLFGNGRQIGRYVELWTELLSPEDPELKATMTINGFPYAKGVAPAIFSRFFAETVTILRSLDLSYESSLHGAEDVVLPNNPVDQDLLLNLATFFQQLFVVHRSKLGDLAALAGKSGWLPLLVQECIRLSESLPLVSALYRLLRTLCSELELAGETAALLREFYLRLEPKLAQFSDELLEAALGMILDARPAVLSFDGLLSPLVVAFSTGVQVSLAVETLERRIFDDDSEEVDLPRYLPRILPLLDKHLVVAGAQGERVKGSIKVGSRSTARAAAKSAMATAAAAAATASDRDSSRAILRLLGRLGGNSQLILRPPEEAVQASLSWSPSKCIQLELSVPVDAFASSSSSSEAGGGARKRARASAFELRLTLDRLLPRVVELCGSSNLDAALRVTAAESLHSLVIFMVGAAARPGVRSAVSVFAPLYRRIFPTVIDLASSAGVSRTLFDKLLFQLVRWFSGHEQVHEDEVSALLDALVTGVCDSANGGSREVCARGFAEFYKFALKQGTKKQLARAPGVTDMMLRRLFTLTAHPSEDTRLGATIALGRVYTFFREETSQKHRYAMQTIYTLLRSMRLGGSPSFLAECARVVKHYRDIVFRSLVSRSGGVEDLDSAKLIKKSDEREMFPSTLAELVEWLWEGMGAPVKFFRRACMVTFAKLCPLLVQHTEKQQYISRVRDNIVDRQLMAAYFSRQILKPQGAADGYGTQALVTNLEKDALRRAQMSPICPPWDGVSEVQGRVLHAWMLQLLAAIDTYIWLIQNKTVPLKAVFPPTQGSGAAAAGSATGKRSRAEEESKNAYCASVVLDCLASLAAEFTAQPKAGSSAAASRPAVCSKELLLVAADVEETRQEVLEKALWFLSECLKDAVREDEVAGRVPGLQGVGDSARFVLLLRSSQLWSTPFQTLLLSYLLSLAGDAVSSASTTASAPSTTLRSKEIPKMAEEFLCFLPLLEETGGAMDVVDGAPAFLKLLTDALVSALGQLQSALVAKKGAPVVGVTRILSLLFRLHKHGESAGRTGILTSVFGADFQASLRKSTATLVCAVVASILTADALQLDLGRKYLLLALDMGFPLSLSPHDVIDGDGFPMSVLDLLLNASQRKSSAQSLARFVEHFGDVLAQRLLETLSSPQPAGQLITTICESKQSSLPMRVLVRAMSMALVDADGASARIVVSACSGSLDGLPWDAVVLLLELDKREPMQHLRSRELFAYLQQTVLRGLLVDAKPASEVLKLIKVLPYLLAGVVADCPRHLSVQPDDESFAKQLLAALDHFVAARFQLPSRKLVPSLDAVKTQEYSSLFHAYLDAFAATGSVLLLHPLLPSLREGHDHLYYPSIRDSLAEVVKATLTEPPVAPTMDVVDQHTSPPGHRLLTGCLELMLREFSVKVKSLLLSKLCLPLLRRLSSTRLVQYACLPFVSHGGQLNNDDSLVKRMMSTFEPPADPVELRSQEDADNVLVNKTCAFRLLETIFDLCHLASIKRDVTAAFVGSDAAAKGLVGNELSRPLITAAHKCSRNTPDGAGLACAEVKHHLCASAFSCLGVVMAKTQPEKNLNSFVLSPADHATVMARVISSSVSVGLRDFSFDTKLIRGLSCSEDEACAILADNASGKRKLKRIGGSSRRRAGPGRGLHSQFAGTLVEQSSLSQGHYRLRDSSSQASASQISVGAGAFEAGALTVDNSDADGEMDGPAAGMPPYGAAAGGGGSISSALEDMALVLGFDDPVILIELKDFNNLPIMHTLVRVINKMHESFEAGWTDGSLPDFAQQISQRLLDPGAKSRHVRLFYLRLVLNKPVCQILRRWAQALLLPVLSVVVEDLCSDDHFPEATYFLRDAVQLFCDPDAWAGACSPRSDGEVALASRLLSAMLQRVFHETPIVNKANQRCIAEILCEWMPAREPAVCERLFVGLSLAPLIALMRTAFEETGGKKGSDKSMGMAAMKQRLMGLELFHMVLATGSPVLEPADDDERRRKDAGDLLACALSCIDYPRKEVMTAGSTMCGILLNALSLQPRTGRRFYTSFDSFRSDLETRLMNKLGQKDGSSNIAACLNGIMVGYPAFLEKNLLQRMTGCVLSLKPRAKYELLKALFLCTNRFERPLPEILLDFWPMLLKDLTTVSFGRRNNVPAIQLFSLKILSKHAQELSLNLLEKLLGSESLDGLTLAVNDRSILDVRFEAYNLLIKICSDHPQLRCSADQADARGTPAELSRVAALRSKALSFLLKGVTDADTEGLEELQSSLAEKAKREAELHSKEQEQDREAFVNRKLGSGAVSSSSAALSADAALAAEPALPSTAAAPSKRIGIRRRVLDFFALQFGLDPDPFKRLLSLMTDLFDPSFADCWLNYSSYLILALGKTSPQYTVSLYNHSLADASTYSQLALRDAGSKTARLSSAPRFSLEVSQSKLSERALTAPHTLTASQRQAASQLSQIMPALTQSRDMSQRLAGQLRSTQEGNWTQTQMTQMAQSQQAGGMRKLLPGQMRREMVRSQDAFGGIGFTQAYSESAVVGLAAGPGSGPGLGLGEAAGFDAMPPPVGLPSWTLTTQRRGGAPASQQQGQSLASGTSSSPQVRAKKPGIVVYRKYRDGELPDICISQADLLQPLQALCLRDAAIATTFFELVFQSLYEGEAPDAQTSRALRDTLVRMLERSAGSANTALVSGLLSSCLLCLRRETAALSDASAKKVRGVSHPSKSEQSMAARWLRDLPSGLVADRALATLNYHAGISVLEEQLIGLERLSALARTKSTAASQASDSSVSVTTMQLVWRELGRLYEGLGDRDVLLGLSSRMSHLSSTQRALEFELACEYTEAGKLYEQLLKAARNDDERDDEGDEEKEKASPEEKQLWSTRALECCRQLCDWKAMYTKCHSLSELITDTSLRDFDDVDDERPTLLSILAEPTEVDAASLDRLRVVVLPYYVQSLVGRAELTSEELRGFTEGLQQSPNVSAGFRQAVEAGNSADVATAYAIREEWGRVRPLVDDALGRFVKSWASLHPCAWQARRNLLHGLTRLCELDEAAVAHVRVAGGSSVSALNIIGGGGGGGGGAMRADLALGGAHWDENLALRWRPSAPAEDAPLWVWDALVRGRTVALKSKDDYLCQLAAEGLANLHVSVGNAAVQQGVLEKEFIMGHIHQAIALNSIGSPSEIATEFSEMMNVAMISVTSDFNQRQLEKPGSVEPTKYCTRITALINKWEKTHPWPAATAGAALMDVDADAEADVGRAAGGDGGRGGAGTWAGKGKVPLQDVMAVKLKRAQWGALHHRVQADAGQAYDDAEQLQLAMTAQTDFARVLGDADSDDTPGFATEADRRITSMRADAAGGLARLCLTQIAHLSDSRPDTDELARLTIDSVLRGLKLGSQFCRNQVMQVLEIIGRFPAAAQAARASERLSSLPPWVFLAHSATLFGCLDRPEGRVAAAVLGRLMDTYPEAMHYPLRIAVESLAYREGAQGHLQELQKKLHNPSLNSFVAALTGLTHPELRWLDGIKRLKQNRGPGKGPVLQRIYNEFCTSVLGQGDEGSGKSSRTMWEHVGSKIGKYNKTIAQKIWQKIKLEELMGKNGEKLAKAADPKDLIDALEAETKSLNLASNMGYREGRVALEIFSQWLSDFDPSKHRIEIPGQYLRDEDRPPAPERHATIVSFDPELLVLSSIRKPKRIRVLGSGGVDALFLVKGGEDLRNDERIERLFGLMNSLVAGPAAGAEASASSRGLAVKTYCVVPLSVNGGLLEWVSNTEPLKSIITDELARDEPFCQSNDGFRTPTENGRFTYDLTNIKAREEQEDWIGKAALKVNDPSFVAYHWHAKNTTRANSIEQFRSMTALVPQDILRRRLLRMAPSPECYLTLRASFARSLAATCVTGYLLGVGDRHLENLLLDTTSGALVPIDFGTCFGIGASLLPVPELIPFRLTATLRGVLLPLDGQGLLRHYMVQALTRLRAQDSAGLLADRLEVYVRDPVMDWIRESEKENAPALAENKDWEPRRRVESARRKLKGIHPAALMAEDLAGNMAVKQFKSFAKLKEALDAAAPGAEQNTQLTPVQQVEALLRLATDEQISMLSYVGLNLFL